MLLKIDMHVHTHYSDSTGSIEDILNVAKCKRLDGIAITDHHTVEGAMEALTNVNDLIVIPGEEIETTKGDILALGVKKSIPKGLSIKDAIKQVHAQKGLVIIPHPTIPFFSKIKEKELCRLSIDGLEVFSAISPLVNYYAIKNMELAKRLNLSILAGSDSHFPETVGDAYTIIDAESHDYRHILDAIKMGRTKIGCNPSKLIFKIKMVKVLAKNILGHRPNKIYTCPFINKN